MSVLNGVAEELSTGTDIFADTFLVYGDPRQVQREREESDRDVQER